MNKQKFTYLLIIFFTSISIYSQTTSFGGGFTAGYKSILQEQGVYGYVRIKRKLDVQAGYSIQGKYNGQGFGGGLRWIIIDKKLQPFIGAASSYNLGRKVNLASDGVKGIYSVSSNSMIYGEAGVMFKYEKSDTDTKTKLTLLLIASFTYRDALNKYSVNFIEMDYSKVAENNLYNRVGKGFGGSLGIIVLFNRIKEK
jgi:hypothetical protein